MVNAMQASEAINEALEQLLAENARLQKQVRIATENCELNVGRINAKDAQLAEAREIIREGDHGHRACAFLAKLDADLERCL